MSTQDAIYRVPAIPTLPIKILASGFAESGGGMAANASVAIARLGGRSHYWGRVGDDALGTRILGELAAEGVDVSRTRRIPGCASPSSAILVADDGERLICAYNDPALDPDPAWLPLAEVGSSAAVLADVRWPQGAAAVLDAARRAGRLAVFDGDVGPPDVLLDLARRATHVLFSTAGAAIKAARSWRRSGADGRDASRDRRGDPRPDGFLWREAGVERRIPAFAIRSIDTLAAGDIWHGAFTLALAEGAVAVETAARFANAAAAIKCTRIGGRSGAPRRGEVDALLASGAKTY
jgi:sulfofructose kinase